MLFCDLVGFTPLSESRDPEAVRELLDRYFATARTVIERHGGTVEKFIGDAVMAVWGTPVTTEEDAERAVRAALQLVDSVAALGQEVEVPSLAARAGVVTGEVAVRIGATNEGMVVGDPVNTAARVQSAADAGRVLIDDGTARRVRNAVLCDDAGQHRLKGKAEPLHLWSATRVLANVGGAQRIDGLEAPLIGRDVELRLVKDLFHTTLERRSGRLVLVTGEAGAGKSRIGWEFEKYVDGLADAVWWHRSRCLTYGDGVALWALAEMVRQRLGIAEDDTTETALALLLAGLDTYIADPTERDTVGIRLGRLLGLRVPDDDGRDLTQAELFAGWSTWLLRLAATAPVVWVIEDLHHADTALLDFIDHLLDRTRTTPVHVLALARTDLDDRAPGWSAGRHRQRITLEPLDDPSMRRLLERLVEGLPDAAVSRIAAQAAGNPLFAVETIRSLVDQDVVQPHDGVYRLVGELGELQVPDSLRALLAARLDNLGPTERAVIADASVLGTTFTLRGLAAISGMPVERIAASVDVLIARELLAVHDDPLSPEAGTIAFAHDLLRRVAYDTISRRDRRSRHLAAAAHLRSTFANDGEEVADVIARHLLDAAEAVPEDPATARIRTDAVAQYTRAGHQAIALGAQSRAAANFAIAAEHSEGVAAAALFELASEAARTAARYDDAVHYAERAQDLYHVAGERRAAARSQVLAATALSSGGTYEQSRALLAAAVVQLEEDPDIDTVRALCAIASNAVFYNGEDAERLSRHALTVGQQLDAPPDLMSMMLTNRGVLHELEGRRTESAAYLREAARMADTADSPRSAAAAYINLASGLAIWDPAASMAAALDGVERSRRAGLRGGLAVAFENVADAQLALGRWDDSAEVLRAAVEVDGLEGMASIDLARGRLTALRGDTAGARARTEGYTEATADMDDPEPHCFAAFLRALVAQAEDEAGECLRQSRIAFGDVGRIGIHNSAVIWAWSLAARAAHELRERTTARELFDALDAYSPTELPPMLRAERALAEARHEATWSSGSDDDLARAVEVVRRDSTPWHLAHALLDRTELLRSPGHRTDVGPLVAEAITIGERLGAEPLLRRARAVLAAIPDLTASA